MNIKLNVKAVHRLLDIHISQAQVYNSLAPIVEKSGIHLAEMQIGVDFLQWKLPGDDWVAFKNLSDSVKPVAADEFKKRKTYILSNGKIPACVLDVPSESDFVFFRKNGLGWDIALTAWAYKFVEKSGGQELDTWREKKRLQNVNIGFLWDKRLLARMPFKLEGYIRYTSEDGLFRVDGQLPVNNEYRVETNKGISFVLNVIDGQSDYIYDLTQFFHVEIRVKKDDESTILAPCNLSWGERQETLTLDEHGVVCLTLPLSCDIEGGVLQSQPDCIVTYKKQIQQQTPHASNETLIYEFAEEAKPEPSPQPNPEPIPAPSPKPLPNPTPIVKEPEFVIVKLVDYEGFPLVNMPFTLKTKLKGLIKAETDAKGEYVIQKDWLTPKEKLDISFVVTPEYQEKHDIHDSKKK